MATNRNFGQKSKFWSKIAVLKFLNVLFLLYFLSPSGSRSPYQKTKKSRSRSKSRDRNRSGGRNHSRGRDDRRRSRSGSVGRSKTIAIFNLCARVESDELERIFERYGKIEVSSDFDPKNKSGPENEICPENGIWPYT